MSEYSTTTLSAAAEQANAALLSNMLGFNLPATMEGDRIDCGFHDMQVWCEEAVVNEEKGVASLVISLWLGDVCPFTITEKVSHFGADGSEAIREAASIWSLSVFVPAAALADPEALPGNMAGLTRHSWSDEYGQQQAWVVTSSPAMRHTLGHDPVDDAVYPAVNFGTRLFLEPVFEELALSTQPRVLKIHLMRTELGSDGNCAINGVSNRSLTNFLLSHDWAHGRSGTLRQYHMMMPCQ